MKKTNLVKFRILYAFIGIFVWGGLGVGSAHAAVIYAQYVDTSTASSHRYYQWQKIGSGYSQNVGSVTVKVDSTSYNGTTAITTIEAYTDSGYSNPDFGSWCSGTGSGINFNGGGVFLVTETYTGCTLNPSLYYAVLMGSVPSVQLAPLGSASATGFTYSSSGAYPVQANADANISGAFLEIDDSPSFTPPVTDTTTHFISVSPESGTTTATTSSIGAHLYVNPTDTDQAGSGYARLHVHLVQDGAWSCQNSGAVYDAINNCSGSNSPASPIDVDLSTTTLNRLLAGEYTLSTFITFGGGGKWNGTYTIENVSYPWYYLGLVPRYDVVVSTTTQFVIGQLSYIDVVREAIASSTAAMNRLTQTGIGAILASTTASLKSICNPLYNFDPAACLALLVWPGNGAILADFNILKQTPPWGYAFRFIDILNGTTSTSTLPKVSYTLSSTSPFYPAMTDITFDPLGTLQDSGTFISSIKSDQAVPMDLWQIVMPAVNVIVYLTLGFMILKDLTNVHKHDDGWSGSRGDRARKQRMYQRSITNRIK